MAGVVTLTEVLVAPAADARTLRRARAAIAALHPISIPDAYCLAAARHIGEAVASFDERLLRAATAEDVPVVTRSA